MMKYKGHYTVIGPPGTGKTTWIASQIKKICDEALGGSFQNQSPVLVCSLTKAAAAEAAGRDLPLPPEAVATMHAHGFRTMDGVVLITGKMIKEVFNADNPGFAITPEDVQVDDELGPTESTGEQSIGDRWASDYHLLRHCMTPRDQWPPATAAWARKWEQFKESQNAIDFTDMIEYASEEPPFNPKIIICDEAQDMSALEMWKLKQWGDAAGALITVGDPWQALYVWRGAQPDSLLNDLHENPEHFKILKQSWRIPAAVHEVATNWIKKLSTYEEIEYLPKVGDPGHVEQLSMSRYTAPKEMLYHVMDQVDQGKTCMLQLTCNHMAGVLCHYLREEGIPFSNPWRKHNHRWNPLAERKGISMSQRVTALLKAARPVHGEDRRMWDLTDIFYWANAMKVGGMFQRGAKKKMAEMATQYPNARFETEHRGAWFLEDSLTEQSNFGKIWSWFERTDRGEDLPVSMLLDIWIAGLDASHAKAAKYIRDVVVKQGAEHLTKEPQIYVGTIHSFKGGEADVVYLWPDISPRSMDGYCQGGGEEHDSVIRAFYVGITRAKQSLYLCEGSNANAVEIL
jgi:DNA helicase II / ATP-dependent DNA helicase PcrA